MDQGLCMTAAGTSKMAQGGLMTAQEASKTAEEDSQVRSLQEDPKSRKLQVPMFCLKIF